MCLSILALGIYMIADADVRLREIKEEKDKCNNGEEPKKES